MAIQGSAPVCWEGWREHDHCSLRRSCAACAQRGGKLGGSVPTEGGVKLLEEQLTVVLDGVLDDEGGSGSGFAGAEGAGVGIDCDDIGLCDGRSWAKSDEGAETVMDAGDTAVRCAG